MASIAYLTRQPGDLVEYEAAFATHGVISRALPVTMQVIRGEGVSELERHLQSKSFDWLVVTSPFSAHLLTQSLPLATGKLRIAAIGPQTAAPIEAAGFVVDHVAQVATAKAMARELIGRQVMRPGQRAIYPRALGGLPDLADGLSDANIEVVCVNTYETQNTPQDDVRLLDGKAEILAGDVAYLLVFAPSQARALAAVLSAPPPSPTVTAAIGPTTADALRALGIDCCVLRGVTPADRVSNLVHNT